MSHTIDIHVLSDANANGPQGLMCRYASNKHLCFNWLKSMLEQRNSDIIINWIGNSRYTTFKSGNLILYLIETPFKAFANNADPDQAAA